VVIAGGRWVEIVIFDAKPDNLQFWWREKWPGGWGRKAIAEDTTTNSQWRGRGAVREYI